MTISDRSASKVLQDTFDELQAQLVKMRKEAVEGGEQKTERSIEEVVTDLARRALKSAASLALAAWARW